MRAHLRDACAKAELECGACNYITERAKLAVDNHSCDFEILKTGMRDLASQLNSVKTELAESKTVISESKTEIA